MGIVNLRVSEIARKAGVKNPFALSRATGIGYAICYRLWNSGQSRIDLNTLARLCDSLNCQPGDLLAYDPKAKKLTTKKRGL